MGRIVDLIASPNELLSAIKNYAIVAGKATTKIMLELYYVMLADSTSSLDKFLIAAAIAYQTIPKEILSTSKLGLFGLVDNVATLLFAYNKVQKSVTPEISSKVEALMAKWFDGDGNDKDVIVLEYKDES